MLATVDDDCSCSVHQRMKECHRDKEFRQNDSGEQMNVGHSEELVDGVTVNTEVEMVAAVNQNDLTHSDFANALTAVAVQECGVVDSR